jgi:hypothetical protein
MLDWSIPGKKYYEMVIDHMHLSGMKSLPIINRKDHPQQYREWYAYFGFRKMLASLELMRDKDAFTVPTQSPFDFDAAFSLGRTAPECPRSASNPNRPPPTEEQRARAAEIMAKFKRPPRT